MDFGALTTSMSGALADKTEGQAHKRKMQDKKMGMKLARSALELKRQTVKDCTDALLKMQELKMPPEVIAAAQKALLRALAS